MSKLQLAVDNMLTLLDDSKWVHVAPIAEPNFNRIVTLIRAHESTNPDIPITLERSLDSFGFDELDLIELVMAVEDEFGFVEMLDQPDVEACKTVGDLVALVEKELEKCA